MNSERVFVTETGLNPECIEKYMASYQQTKNQEDRKAFFEPKNAEVRLYSVRPYGYFIGNGNHRLLAAQMVDGKVPEDIPVVTADEFIGELLMENAKKVRRKYGRNDLKSLAHLF